MSGFVAMQREALEHPLFRGNPDRFYAWFWLVARAAWKPTPFDVGGKVITVQRGQICTSRSQLAAAWNWSPSAVERFLARLETEQMIGRATGQGRSIITICNYSKYQDKSEKTGQANGQQTGQQSDSDRTTKEPLNHLTIELGPNGPCASDDAPPPANDDVLKPEHVVEAWNDTAQRIGLPKVINLNDPRRKRLRTMIRQHPPDDFARALDALERSPLCRGEKTDWRADFDFFLQTKSFTKLLEGAYG